MSESQIIRYATGVNKKKTRVVQLDQLIDLKETDHLGNTLLHIALKNEKLNETPVNQMLEILLDRGLDINAKNGVGKTIMHLAIELRHKAVIDFCIRRNADLHITDSNGNTFAHFAIEEEYRRFYLIGRDNKLFELENESSSFVDWLVTKGFDFFYSKNTQNDSALYFANELGLQHILLTLLKRHDYLPSAENDQPPLLCTYLKREGGLDELFKYETLPPINPYIYEDRNVYNILKAILEKFKSMSNETLNSALSLAINTRRSFDEINLILQHTTNILQDIDSIESIIRSFTSECIDYQVWTRQDGMKILRDLVHKGADINEQLDNGETIALKWFRNYQKIEMLKLLQDCGADFNALANTGDNILHLISRYSKEVGMIDLLAKDGYDLNITNSRKETPLQLAITYGNVIVANELLKSGANVYFIDDDGISPLSLACEMGEIEIVKALIYFEADLKYTDENGKNLLHIALKTQRNCDAMVELLVEHGADVDAKDYLGKTPLHYATNVSHFKTLYDADASVDVLDDECYTPLYCAMSENSALMEALLKCGADILDPKILQLAKDRFSNPSDKQFGTFQYTINYFAKMNAAGLLNEIPGANCRSEVLSKMFLKKCEDEVELLKNFKIDDSTSLYKLLGKNRNRVCAYVDNKVLKNLVEGWDLSTNFPNYFVLIKNCYNEAVIRKPLLEKAVNALKKIIKVSLPDLCIDQIIMYLGNAYLLRLIDIDEMLKKM